MFYNNYNYYRYMYPFYARMFGYYPLLRKQSNSGSSILINNGTSLIAANPGGGLLKGASSGGDTPVPVIFPDADPSWFYNGYPGVVDAGTADGTLVDYIPVSFYAKYSGKVQIALNENPDLYVGYIDHNGNFTKTISYNQANFNKGDFVFATLVNKTAKIAVDSKIENRSYWSLLSEVSNILPGQTLSKAVSVTTGVTNQESKTFSTTVGATVGFKAGFSGSEISASLSTSLTKSFSSSVSVTTQQTITDTINFPAQDRKQRAALYQFIEKYNMKPGKQLVLWRDYLNSTQTQESIVFSKQFVCSIQQPPPFDYPSKYYATSFILEPSS